MLIIKSANLALRFLLELCALAALGYWGFQAGQSLVVKIALAIISPLLAAVIWGMFVAPKASVPVSTPVWLLLQLAIFGLAVLVNSLLLYLWRQ